MAAPLYGYSVLTHEAVIDSAWDHDLKPLLLQRFPRASPDQLREAHGYAYAGCIIQDMGYYPFGSKEFSDLVHYVRSGDFIQALLAEAQDLNEYAFALGALAHYSADNNGHRIAVNPSVGAEYPKLEAKYGSIVTYADDPTAHLRVEFGFDVLQVARGAYGSQAYHDFIGFHVAEPLLERAFHDTYGLELKDVFGDLHLAIGTYRHAVSSVIPEMTKVAWKLKKKELAHSAPRVSRRQFVYNLSRASYEKEWDRDYRRPGFGTRVLVILFRILPKVGPFKIISFKVATPETALWFEDSFDRTLNDYHHNLAALRNGRLALANTNFDTGGPVGPGTYKLADDAYAKLVIKLEQQPDAAIDPKLRSNILSFYRNLDAPFSTKADPRQWARTLEALAKLRQPPVSAARSQPNKK